MGLKTPFELSCMFLLSEFGGLLFFIVYVYYQMYVSALFGINPVFVLYYICLTGTNAPKFF